MPSNKILILHRTLGSPYSQKIMAMLDYSQANWMSVIAPKGVPRPIQEKLANNYSRRIPILQIGADIYCDTDLISKQIAIETNNNYLDRTCLKQEEREFIDYCENEIFISMLVSLSPIDFIIGYFRSIPPKEAFEFLKDRIKIKKKHPEFNLNQGKSKEAHIQASIEFIHKMDNMLSKRKFLFNDLQPTLSDFTAYNHIWYHYQLNKLKLAKDTRHIIPWLERIDSFNSSNLKELKPETALEIAESNSPLKIPESMNNSSRIGKKISFSINDKVGEITSPIHGVLAGEDNYKIILKHHINSSNFVHIHIPKQCYGACG
ncbi:glutathione S-transferase N-terminal domain-containing protein [Aureibacter tunicatorum]|nr:glutathione S-transferase N-terminal domain-containing protein [Aureibacter tunicatorum]BDD04925.1 glutathione S-transferase [Aureibacter tunicatorum]